MPALRHRAAAGLPKLFGRCALLLLSGLPLAAAVPTLSVAQSVAIEQQAPADPYAAFVVEASQRFDVPEGWIRAVMRVESRGDVRAMSPAGAMGLMQIMPDTWADLRFRHSLGSDPFSPRDNILAGAAYLREMHDRYGSPGFLAAYNAGPARYEEYVAGARALPAETCAYVTALAPIVDGGEIARPVIVAAADPLAWTRAPLFIGPAASISAVDPTQLSSSSDDAPAAAPVRDLSAISPLSDGLFVARPGSGDGR